MHLCAQMALILQIETSTTSCSVALSENGHTIALKEINERNAHASSLTLFIEDVLRQKECSPKDLSAVAVSMGPGSYTGLRIGVSAAKGLCYALDIPLIAVGTLKAMASGISSRYKEPGLLFCPMIDARRMEVYTAVFNQAAEEVAPVEAKIIDATSFSDLLKDNKMIFFGDGALKCRETLGGNPNAVFDTSFVNSAADLSAIAYRKFTEGRFEDTAYFEPYYLKDFIAGKPKAEKKD